MYIRIVSAKMQFMSRKTVWRNVPGTQSKYAKRKMCERKKLRCERLNYLELKSSLCSKTYKYLRENKEIYFTVKD